MPILRRGPGSTLRACCLRNSDSWNTVEDYLSDYNQIPDTNTLDALAQVLVLVHGNEKCTYPLADYTFYTWSRPGPHTFSSLLPRRLFTKWFYSLFFRLALPIQVDLALKLKIIFSPLNFCTLFRLIAQLRGFGYPSHWLSEALLNLIHSTVTTTARPPRTKPMRPADVKREYPLRKLCTVPFSHELATLARIFQPLLPFQLISPTIPLPEQIFKYSFSLEGYTNLLPQPNCLILVFINEFLFPKKKTPKSVLYDLRLFLDPSTDELVPDFKDRSIEQMNEEGIIVWTSFDWDKERKVANAWMSEAFASKVGMKGWSVGLWRTDIWEHTCAPPLISVENVVEKGKSWAV